MMRMWQGAVGIAPVDGLVSPAYVVARPFPEIDAAYYAYLFRTATYMREIDVFSRGIVPDRNRLYWESFKQMPSAYPPLDEQRLIVRFLDWHGAQTAKLIRTRRKLIALLNEQKQAIIHRAVTHGLDLNTKLKSSGIPWLGNVPQHWEIVRSGSMFRLFSGFAFTGDGFVRGETNECLPILLTPVNFDPMGGLRFGLKSTVRFRGAFPPQFELAKGALETVLTDLSSKRLILGRAGFVDRDAVLLNQRTARIDIHANQKSRLDVKCLCFVLNSMLVREQTISTSRGSTVFHTSPGRMLAAQWPLPPREEQHAIIGKLEALEYFHQVIRDQLLSEIVQIDEFRARLIADVVTGKLDVRAAAARLPEMAEFEAAVEPPDDEGLETDPDSAETEDLAA